VKKSNVNVNVRRQHVIAYEVDLMNMYVNLTNN